MGPEQRKRVLSGLVVSHRSASKCAAEVPDHGRHGEHLILWHSWTSGVIRTTRAVDALHRWGRDWGAGPPPGAITRWRG